MNDIGTKRASIWCERFGKLMEENGYTQESFLKEYKKKYGGGTQANVSRWLGVGRMIKKDGTPKAIGFPSYENMLNIADFFDVTVGYLTGETDFETFEMEKACKQIGIDEDTGKAIKGIVTGESVEPFGKYEAKELRAVFKYLVTANSFPVLIKKVREYAENVYYMKNHINYLEIAKQKIGKDIIDLAIQCMDYQVEHDDEYGDIDDFKENGIERTEELSNAIRILNEAEDKGGGEVMMCERDVELSEYKLQKVYFEIIKEIVSDKNLPEMAIPRNEDINLAKIKCGN